MIEIFVDGRCFGALGAAFGVVMLSGRHEWKRSIKCGKITTNQSELQAVLFSLTCVKAGLENEKIIVYTKNKYIPLVLSRTNGVWDKPLESFDKNQDLIKKVRTQFERFKNLDLKLDVENPILASVRCLTDNAIKTGQEVNKCI